MDINSPICRVCMQHAMELIDFEDGIEDGSTLTVLDSFNFCTQLSATKDDELPKHLCTSCGDELRNAFNFVRKAQEADTALRQKIKEEISQETAYVIVQTEDNYDGGETIVPDLTPLSDQRLFQNYYQSRKAI